MIITSVFSFYAALDTSSETREQTQGDKEVVQAVGMWYFFNLQDLLGKLKTPGKECCQWQLWAQASQAPVSRKINESVTRCVTQC